MIDKSIEKELQKLETQYWQAIKTKDFETALSLFGFPIAAISKSAYA